MKKFLITIGVVLGVFGGFLLMVPNNAVTNYLNGINGGDAVTSVTSMPRDYRQCSNGSCGLDYYYPPVRHKVFKHKKHHKVVKTKKHHKNHRSHK